MKARGKLEKSLQDLGSDNTFLNRTPKAWEKNG
jgi:hypothetical protein